jgi:hypothetical protein
MKKKEESEKRERKKEVVCGAAATVARQISTLFFGSAKVSYETSKSKILCVDEVQYSRVCST